MLPGQIPVARIGIDATPLSLNGKGLSRFLVSLISELSRHQTDHQFVIFVNKLVDLPELPVTQNIQYVQARIRNSLVWDLCQLPLALRHYRIDLLQSCSDRLPFFFSGQILHYLFEIPKYRHRLSEGKTTIYVRLSMTLTATLFPRSLSRANHILTSSHATAKAIVNEYAVPLEKVTVLYPGIEKSFHPVKETSHNSHMREHLGAPEGYVLHFSSLIDRRDNTEIALRAFSTSLKIYPHNRKLVIAGKTDPAKQGLESVVHELGLDKAVRWIGFVPEENLVDVYQGADLYLDTSLYEGFGFQVLEAMACGTPVVCSNVTSLPEIVGNAAITARPDDVEGFAHGIVDLLSSLQRAGEMRQEDLNALVYLAGRRWSTKCLKSTTNSYASSVTNRDYLTVSHTGI